VEIASKRCRFADRPGKTAGTEKKHREPRNRFDRVAPDAVLSSTLLLGEARNARATWTPRAAEAETMAQPAFCAGRALEKCREAKSDTDQKKVVDRTDANL
jgi:hypothetical protein